MSAPHILAVDQSTASSKVYLLDKAGSIVRQFAKEHRQQYPKSGQVEHDAEEIWQNVLTGIRKVAGADQVAGLAISNQRETTVFWDPSTGAPLCPAVVWQDVRSEYICRELAQHAPRLREITGLALSAYFPAAKIAAKLREDPGLRRRAEQGRLCIGTMDSYLMFRLTQGEVFATDVSNASRTQLMSLADLRWSREACGLFDIPEHCLPAILPSDAIFGQVRVAGLPQVPITGVMGDSHAALFGQGCHQAGMAKATFGTGSSVMMHVGNRPLLSSHGLSASVGYAFGGSTCYVLEGNVTSSGDTLRWLVEDARLANSLQEVEEIAAGTPDPGQVYFVPAFSGLGAPHQHPDARAVIHGLHRGSKREHIVRAALESMAYQDVDILTAMAADLKGPLALLRTDGGPSANPVLMQFLADLLGCQVQCAPLSELSALGAGIMAGHTLQLYPYPFVLPPGKRYAPKKDAAWRREKMNGWLAALRSALPPTSTSEEQ